MRPITLTITLDQLNKLHRLVDGKNTPVKVDPALIRQLLIDHSIMAQTLEDAGCRLITARPKPQFK